MGRVINFIANTSCDSMNVITDLANGLSSNKKVCVVDMDFCLNQFVYSFYPMPKNDIKECLINGKSYHSALNKINSNLFVIKTSNIFFDYQKFTVEISLIIKQIASDFDYVFLVGFVLDSKSLEIRNSIATEMILIIDNRLDSILFAKNIIKKSWRFENLKNKKLLLSDFNVFGEIRGDRLSLKKIEDSLKLEVLSLKPSLIMGKKNKKKINSYIKTSVEENVKVMFDYKKSFRGLIGYFRRKFYERFEQK